MQIKKKKELNWIELQSPAKQIKKLNWKVSELFPSQVLLLTKEYELKDGTLWMMRVCDVVILGSRFCHQIIPWCNAH